MQKIIFDGKKCIRCKNCVAESEFNGVKFSEGKIFLDTNQNEDWDSIIEIDENFALGSYMFKCPCFLYDLYKLRILFALNATL